MAPIFFKYQRTPLSLKKTHIALDNFNTYLKRLGTKYAAGGKQNIFLKCIHYLLAGAA